LEQQLDSTLFVTLPLVHIFDHTHSEAQAKRRLHQLRKDSHALEDQHLNKIPQFFAAHWEQALRYLRKKGLGTLRVGDAAAPQAGEKP
jgi:hypothetical protein